MKAISKYYRIVGDPAGRQPGVWCVVDQETDETVWRGKTFRGARDAHYRLTVARITGKPVSYAQSRRAGNS